MQPAATFLHDIARPLFLLHTVAAVALSALCLHVLLTARPVVLGRPGRTALLRRFVTWAFVATLAAVALGLLLYPEYKANVRVLFLDRHAPWVGRVFDIKEYLAIFSLPLIGFLFFARKEFGPEASRTLRLGYGGVLLLWVLVVWAAAVIGWTTATARPIGVLL